MQWWDMYQLRRRLRTRARQAEAQYDAHLEDLHELSVSGEEAHHDSNLMDLYWLARSRVLVHEAEAWDIELPSFADDASWESLDTPDGRVHCLTTDQQRIIRRKIRAAKREIIGWWVQNLIALIGALTGLIAVIKTAG